MPCLRRGSRTLFFLALLAAATGGGAVRSSNVPPLRAWTVEDSIGIRYFSYDLAYPEEWQAEPTGYDGQPVWTAPDGEHFFFLTHRGDLACDCVHYTLSVYSVDHVSAALQAGGRSAGQGVPPLRSVTMDFRGGNLPDGLVTGIDRPRWENDNAILFEGISDHRQTGIYRLEIGSGRLISLTPDDAFIARYDIAGDSVAYWTVDRGDVHSPRPNISDPIQPVRADYLERLSESTELAIDLPSTRYGVRTSRPGRACRAATFPALTTSQPPARLHGVRMSLPDSRPIVSPDGSRAVFMMPVYRENGEAGDIEGVPDGWRLYAGLEGPAALSDPRDFDRFGSYGFEYYNRLWRPMIVDLSSCAVQPLLDVPRGPGATAPSAANPAILWSADGQHVILVNSSIPIDPANPASRTTGYLVDFEVGTGRWSAIAPMQDEAGARIGRVRWLDEGRALFVGRVGPGGAPMRALVYRRGQSGWDPSEAAEGTEPPRLRSAPAATPLRGGLRIALRQSVTMPPIMVASRGGREVALTSPDPALARVRLAPPVPARWTERDGQVVEGELFLPPAASRSGPLPLVVQFGVSGDRFLPDGVVSTAFATQAMVARGIAVLNLPEIEEPTEGGTPARGEAEAPREAALYVERIDAAVEQLARDGIVDPARVGLVGFSRTGYFTYYAISHPRTVRFAAAMINDSSSMSYVQELQRQLEGRAGPGARPNGGTFWNNPQGWLAYAPAFNVNRVDTPALFTFNTFSTSQPMFEALASFRANNREIDMLLLPDASHQLQRPRQRLASMRATVDWMTFWLQGEERRAADRATLEQYRYWRALRAQRDARRAGAMAAGQRVGADIRPAAGARSPSTD